QASTPAQLIRAVTSAVSRDRGALSNFSEPVTRVRAWSTPQATKRSAVTSSWHPTAVRDANVDRTSGAKVWYRAELRSLSRPLTTVTGQSARVADATRLGQSSSSASTNWLHLRFRSVRRTAQVKSSGQKNTRSDPK